MTKDVFPDARTIAGLRRSYGYAFGPVIVSLVTAIGFACWHQWLPTAGFIVQAVIYLPLSLTLYRQKKKIIEKVIQQVEQLRKEQGEKS